MTGYVVHYIGGGSNGTETVPSSSTSTDITGLTIGPTYAISVEATSQHLSGESGVMTIRLRELQWVNIILTGFHAHNFNCIHACAHIKKIAHTCTSLCITVCVDIISFCLHC